VEEHRAAHPVQIGLLGAMRIVLGAKDLTGLIEGFFAMGIVFF
jgi:hypothetical protein